LKEDQENSKMKNKASYFLIIKRREGWLSPFERNYTMIYLIKTTKYQSYFWQGDVREVNGKVVLWRRWGRMGSWGQKIEKEYPSKKEAQDKLKELEQEKMNKGYEDAQSVFMDLADSPFSPWVDQEYLERRMKEIRQG